MQKLLPTLLEHDAGMLAIIAHRWDVDLEAVDKRDAASVLADAMLEPARAAAEWNRLTDRERGALQTLLGAPGHKMPEAKFNRLFGEIRQMGPGRRDREKPYLSPISISETLYYRGLIAQGYDQGAVGSQAFVFVPLDLATVLPVHETGFALEAAHEGGAAFDAGEFTPAQVTPARSVIVDDLTTLLAYLQVARAPVKRKTLHTHITNALAPYWLGGHTPASVALMIGLLGSMGLAASEGETFKLVPARAKPWLEVTRPRQVRALAEAWRTSTLYNDLWHTPGLVPEETGWRNDPLLARQTVLMFLEMAPADQWWPLDELIALVKEEEPDFQRPGGDYDSWYIRDAQTGDYLHGFENWDRVDGAVLRFILTGPMHWLGLVDLGDDGTLYRLTVYGRALVGAAEWPDPDEDRPPITLDDDGTLYAPRMASRYERFQLARITEWEAPGDPYVYRLTIAGLRRAAEQGLPLDAIHAFLRRTTGRDTLPHAVHELLARWEKAAGAELWMTRAVVLRASTADALQIVLETPELRRYIGAQLSPDAVLVRVGQEQDLLAALRDHGISAEFDD